MDTFQTTLDVYRQLKSIAVGIAPLDNLLVRISETENLGRLRTFGTDRADISDMPWTELNRFHPNSYGSIRHDQVIIASYFTDLDKDVLLPQGTFAHKLEIIDFPVIVLYKRAFFVDLMSENKEDDPKNNGTHFMFKDGYDPRSIDSLFLVNKQVGNYCLEPLSL